MVFEGSASGNSNNSVPDLGVKYMGRESLSHHPPPDTDMVLATTTMSRVAPPVPLLDSKGKNL